MNKLRMQLADERGVALVVVLALMALTIPALTAALAFSSTSAISTRTARAESTDQISAAAINDFAVYKLIHDAGFKETLAAGTPVYETIPINGDDAIVSWEKRGVVGGTTPAEDPTVLSTTKVVDMNSIPADTPTTVSYTIQVTNIGLATATVDDVRDGLPPYFDYVNGTTTGATTSNPQKTSHDSGQGGIAFKQLVWDLDAELAPSASLSISFDVQADAPDGHYCNIAWANPGGHDTGTGPTAKVTAGTPSTSLCDNQTVDVRKTVTPTVAASEISTTFHYRVELENLSSEEQEFFWVVDLLPPGLLFDGGTVTGTITTKNPFSWFDSGQQRLFWLLSQKGTVGVGETLWLEFDATGPLVAGAHANQVWVSFEAIGETAYSFPTAVIDVWDVYDIVVVNGETTSTVQIWVAADGSYEVTEWEILQN